jgi:hypothetical protein
MLDEPTQNASGRIETRCPAGRAPRRGYRS